nr:LysR family transcriptional regulator [uncultured Celeribacter sp.]
MAITFRQLQYFLALAEELHFGRAAERLHISQPPLSASLKQLEHTLGFPLMERTNRVVRLTPAGAVFANHARRILGQLSVAEASAAQTAHGGSGTLRVAFVPSMLFRHLPARLRGFRDAHPNVDLILKEMNTARQVEALSKHEIDVGFIHAIPLPPEIDHQTLETERLVCCLPRDHRLATRSRVRLGDLAGERVLVFSREFAEHYHDRIVALLRAAGIAPYPNYHVQNWFTIVALVAQGMGVSLVPKSLGSSTFSDVVYVEIEEADAQHQVSLIWNKADAPGTVAPFVRFISTTTGF